MAVQTQILHRRGTAATWTSTNPTLGAGEIGYETDTGKYKIGTGSAVWTSLAYASILPSTLTAKGDILAASAANTPARQAVGSDGQTLVADSSQTTGLGWANNFAAGKNKIINGDFAINQRNWTSTVYSGSTFNNYGFDRFVTNSAGDGTTTASPQTFTLGSAPVAGYESKNFYRAVTAGFTTTASRSDIDQRIEDVRTFAGQTATVSFWAKAGSGTPKIAVEIAQFFGTGGSPSSTFYTAAGTVTLSTSWARYSVTVAVPSISGKTIGSNPDSYLGIRLWLNAGSDFNTRASSIGIQNNTFDIWGVQVEAGSVATAFQTATGTVQGELAACQRYYYRFTPSAAANRYGAGFCDSTTIAEIYTNFPVQMRTRPTALEQSGTASDYSVRTPASGTVACSAVPQIGNASEWGTTTNFTVASGLTAGNGVLGRAVNTSAYLGWSAEL